MKLQSLPFAALAAFTCALAGCQTTTPNRFDKADKNKNGLLSREEISSALVTEVFESRDTNKDGRLTKAEWLVGDDAGREKLFRDRDTNKDGVVTLEEALAYSQKKGIANEVLREADTNKDGSVSREEATAYYAKREGPAR